MKKPAIRYIITVLFVLLSASGYAQQDTTRGTFVPYGKGMDAARNDTIVKVKRMLKPPGTFLGDILHYLSPVKYVLVDSVYPMYTKDDPFFLHEKNHINHQDFNQTGKVSGEQSWNQINNIDGELQTYPKDTTRFLARQVIGYHPYWMGTAYKNYNFNLLTRIVYFSYELNPTDGDFKTVHHWNETGLISLAHKYGCAVDLSVTNFGSENNRKFIENLDAQNKLIENLIMLLRKRKGDGVNINFEEVPKSHKVQFSEFIIRLRKELLAENSNYKITLTIPAIDWRNAYDVAVLKDHVDFFFLMGYDFYGKYSEAAGPNALLFSGANWTGNNINTTIDTYIKFGAPASSLVLGLPYYGHEWITSDSKVPAKAIKYNGPRSYKYIANNYTDNYVARYDSTSHSMYYVFRDSVNWVQCWFDNEKTLALKYDYINEKRLGGLGIWALGYDNTYPELWNLIGQKFTSSVDTLPDLHTILSNSLEYSVTEKSVMEVNESAPDYTQRFSDRLSLAWKVFVLFFAIVLLFSLVGYIIAIADFDVRFILFTVEVRVYLFFILLAIILLMILRILGMLANFDLLLILSITIGIFAALIVLNIGKMKKENSRKETP
ncbi:MAG TPA: hypothetical protein DCQ31_04085 [Bacteroidales bacterium]|nr:hypothetical protein [Bacteroidales bacterium]